MKLLKAALPAVDLCNRFEHTVKKLGINSRLKKEKIWGGADYLNEQKLRVKRLMKLTPDAVKVALSTSLNVH